jgi:hypothetical protein
MTTQLISLSPGQLQSIEDGFVKFFFSHWVRLFYTLASTLNLKEKWAVPLLSAVRLEVCLQGEDRSSTLLSSRGDRKLQEAIR